MVEVVEEYELLEKRLLNGVKHIVKIEKRSYGVVLYHWIEEDGEARYWFEAIIDAILIDEGRSEKRITAYKNNKKFYEIIIEGEYIGYNIYEDDL